MAWDFETDPDFQEKLDWADVFIRDSVEPLDYALGEPDDRSDLSALAVVRPLQQSVRDHKLWACHLDPELGGQGYGQLKLALLNELLGRSRWAPTIFGCQAPDSGNAEILARYGTDEQKERFLKPLLDGQITSCFSMTEPHAGADPSLFTTRAVRDGTDWVINGEKWFSSNARYASFFLVVAVTDSDAGPNGGMSIFIVPAETTGVRILENIGLGNERAGDGNHAHVGYDNVRVSGDLLLGEEGQGFLLAQTRLSGGRIHHGMRSVAQMRKALDMMCERAVSRQTRSGPLASLPTTQEMVADSWIELEQFRLLVLHTAWLIDKHQDYRRVRGHIAAVKAIMPTVLHNVVQRAIHLHGALGVSNAMPLVEMLVLSEVMGIADGPTEVHKFVLAKGVLRNYTPGDPVFPSEYLPSRIAAARELHS